MTHHRDMVFDDIFNIASPEVKLGVADFLEPHVATLCCCCVTRCKACICHHTYRKFYLDTIMQSKQLPTLERSELELLAQGATAVWRLD